MDTSDPGTNNNSTSGTVYTGFFPTGSAEEAADIVQMYSSACFVRGQHQHSIKHENLFI